MGKRSGKRYGSGPQWMGGEIKVEHNGERFSSGTHFLGSCLGHDVKIGPNVTIGYGEEVPNGAFIVASPDIVMRRIPKALKPGVPHHCVNGEATPVQSHGGALDPSGD